MSSSTLINPTRYGACNNNHKFATGGGPKDGCMEFLPIQSDPYTCDACGCHRSFHKKDDATVTRKAQYGKCCKNRTLKTLSYSVQDGCLEFWSKDNGMGFEVDLMCAACGCHRSFHEREVEGGEAAAPRMQRRSSPVYSDDY